jgi:hypothetical protein
MALCLLILYGLAEPGHVLSPPSQAQDQLILIAHIQKLTGPIETGQLSKAPGGIREPDLIFL